MDFKSIFTASNRTVEVLFTPIIPITLPRFFSILSYVLKNQNAPKVENRAGRKEVLYLNQTRTPLYFEHFYIISFTSQRQQSINS